MTSGLILRNISAACFVYNIVTLKFTNEMVSGQSAGSTVTLILITLGNDSDSRTDLIAFIAECLFCNNL